MHNSNAESVSDARLRSTVFNPKPKAINIHDRDSIKAAVAKVVLHHWQATPITERAPSPADAIHAALAAEERRYLKHIGFSSKYRPHVGKKQQAKELRRRWQFVNLSYIKTFAPQAYEAIQNNDLVPKSVAYDCVMGGLSHGG